MPYNQKYMVYYLYFLLWLFLRWDDSNRSAHATFASALLRPLAQNKYRRQNWLKSWRLCIVKNKCWEGYEADWQMAKPTQRERLRGIFDSNLLPALWCRERASDDFTRHGLTQDGSDSCDFQFRISEAKTQPWTEKCSSCHRDLLWLLETGTLGKMPISFLRPYRAYFTHKRELWV